MRPSVVENEFSLICMTDKQFFFYLFNRRSYAGDLELVKKKVKKKKKKPGRGWVGLRALGAGCGGKAGLLGPLASPTACVIPARTTFFPLSYCTQNRVRELLSAVFLEAPWFLTHCWWVYFNFLIPWTVGYEINARWRQKQPSLPLGAMRGPPRPPTCGGKGFLFLCVLSQHSYQNWTCRHLWAVWSWCEVRDAH